MNGRPVGRLDQAGSYSTPDLVTGLLRRDRFLKFSQFAPATCFPESKSAGQVCLFHTTGLKCLLSFTLIAGVSLEIVIEPFIQSNARNPSFSCDEFIA